jgi:glycosyltransferase involved in cell wall biosynthesis
MGILVPGDDPEALAQAIITLGRDPERRRSMGERAKERIRTTFTIETMAANLVAHLGGLIDH